MLVYVDLARQGFRRHAAYRAAAVAGLFTNTVFGCVRAYVLLAVLAAQPGLGGYDATSAVTFTFLTQALIMAFGGFGPGMDLPQRIRTGDVVVDLLRPVDFHGTWLATDLGRAVWHILARGIGPLVLGALLFGIAVPSTAGRAATFAVALVLGVVVSFSVRYLFVLVGFWMVDNRGLDMVSYGLWAFFSGLFLPLHLFPPGLRQVALVTPWAMTMQRCADAWQGRVGPGGLVLPAVWAVILVVVGRAVTRLAVRKVVVQGG